MWYYSRMIKDFLRKNTVVAKWLPLAITITMLCGGMYIVLQQYIRQSANLPQLQLAQDAAVKLGQGIGTENVVTGDKVDIAASLSPYMIVYNKSQQAIAATAELNSHTPELPSGVLDYVSKNHQDIFTWQPQEGVREAVVILSFSGKYPGYVLAGRSLNEAENQIDSIGHDILLLYLFTMGLTYFVYRYKFVANIN